MFNDDDGMDFEYTNQNSNQFGTTQESRNGNNVIKRRNIVDLDSMLIDEDDDDYKMDMDVDMEDKNSFEPSNQNNAQSYKHNFDMEQNDNFSVKGLNLFRNPRRRKVVYNTNFENYQPSGNNRENERTLMRMENEINNRKKNLKMKNEIESFLVSKQVKIAIEKCKTRYSWLIICEAKNEFNPKDFNDRRINVIVKRNHFGFEYIDGISHWG